MHRSPISNRYLEKLIIFYTVLFKMLLSFGYHKPGVLNSDGKLISDLYFVYLQTSKILQYSLCKNLKNNILILANYLASFCTPLVEDFWHNLDLFSSFNFFNLLNTSPAFIQLTQKHWMHFKMTETLNIWILQKPIAIVKKVKQPFVIFQLKKIIAIKF